MNILKFCIFAFVSVSCFSENSFYDSMSPIDRHMYDLMETTASEIENKYDMQLCGTGLNGKFEFARLIFKIHKPLSKETSRKMLFDCANLFLKKINEDNEIQKYLKPYPFTLENVGITIHIKNSDNCDVYDPEICLAEWNSGTLGYGTISKDNTRKFKTLTEETHEEALTILTSQNENFKN